MNTESSSSTPLCARGCGFYGSVENNNMCSKCYSVYLKLEIINKTQLALTNLSIDAHDPSSLTEDPADDLTKETQTETNTAAVVKDRCECCNKKTGLLGFSCRCGKTICGKHRYAEKHGCAFDYKSFGRQLLVHQNPLVKSDKLNDRL